MTFELMDGNDTRACKILWFQIIENECSENVSAMLLVVTLATASPKGNRNGEDVIRLQRREVGIALKNYSIPFVQKSCGKNEHRIHTDVRNDAQWGMLLVCMRAHVCTCVCVCGRCCSICHMVTWYMSVCVQLCLWVWVVNVSWCEYVFRGWMYIGCPVKLIDGSYFELYRKLKKQISQYYSMA